MGKLFKPRNKTYSAQKGDTLKTIAAAQTDGLTWQEVALFNWGTNIPLEVNRAIIETLGCGSLQADAGDSVIDPARGPDGAAVALFIPELWQGDLAVNQNHVVKARKLKPAPAITITKLDKWFIPKAENCDVAYQLQGLKERAKQVSVAVYGSGYCEINAWNDGFGDYGAALNDEPIFQKQLHADAEQRRGYDFSGDPWDGKSNAVKGALKSASDRYINVAFSPYTVQLRYHNLDADAKAKLHIAPFWPQFDSDAATAKALAASLKVSWEVKDCDKLKQGYLVVVDKDDKPVFMQGLSAGQLTAGLHHFDWGANGGIDLVSSANMPYRVSVQAHTDMDEDDGVALAAMHTEVRLYVAPATHADTLDPYVPATDASSVALGLADLWHKDVEPTQAADGKLWTKFTLAQAGFHPGPVTDASVTPEFRRALHELQKSVPKKKANPADDFSRLTVSDNDDADSRDALASMAAHYRRPWFGKASDRSDYDNAGADLQKDLGDPQQEVICWVDDRYWYSDAGWVPEDQTQIRNTVKNHPSALTEDRGGYTAGDNRVTMDQRDIARPWIPVQMAPVLLSKSETLATEKNPQAVSEAVAEASRLAIGPLRVDWTFDEIDGATVAVAEVDTGMYHKDRTRTKAALEWQLDSNKATYTRKDVKRQAHYFNCLETFGGIRPTATANYFSAVLGVEDYSLHPWKAKPDAAREAVVAVIHDELGEHHAAADRFSKRVGRAGVYFNPSNIAGDGYQLRAQIRFDNNADFKHPNSANLKNRYPKLPQSHTAKIRIWRKASLRGYINWGPNDSFAGSVANFRKMYAASHMHIVNENGLADAAIKFQPNVLFSDLAGYRAMVKELVKPTLAAPGNIRRLDANITVTPNRLWPWHGHDQLGIPESSAANPPNKRTAALNLYRDHAAPYYYRLAVRMSSEIARLLEAKHGLMRGNVIVEMLSSDKVDYRSYDCDTCATTYVYLEKQGVAATQSGATCPGPLCAGHLKLSACYVGNYACANGHTSKFYESNSTGGEHAGRACSTAGCGSTYSLSTGLGMRYQCNTCNFNERMPETLAAGHGFDATPCPRGDCAGVLAAVGGAPAVPANGPTVEVWPSRAVPLYDNLPVPSLGNPVGVALNFHGGYELWAHEVGHTRYMEHAANAPASRGGATAQALQDLVHDAVANPDPLVSADALSKNWDRACYMTYASHLPNYDPVKDKTYMCYKCVLKNRGWRIENIASNPPGHIRDL